MESEVIISNRVRIEGVFNALEERGIIARADFWCCNSCASSAMLGRELPAYERNGAEHQPVGYVFFHEQDTDSANEGRALLLSHGSINEADDNASPDEIEHAQGMVARIVVEEFREHGFEVEWNGSLGTKISVIEPSEGWYLDYDREADDEDDDDEDDYED
jgi:hypothetical protein